VSVEAGGACEIERDYNQDRVSLVSIDFYPE
jgi:hypothetical protein